MGWWTTCSVVIEQSVYNYDHGMVGIMGWWGSWDGGDHGMVAIMGWWGSWDGGDHGMVGRVVGRGVAGVASW